MRTNLLRLLVVCVFYVKTFAGDDFETIPLSEDSSSPNSYVTIQTDAIKNLDLGELDRAVFAPRPSEKIWKILCVSANLFMAPEFWLMGVGFFEDITKSSSHENALIANIFFGAPPALAVIFRGGESVMDLVELLSPEKPELQKYIIKHNRKVKTTLRLLELGVATFISTLSGPALPYLFYLSMHKKMGAWVHGVNVPMFFAGALSFMSFHIKLMRFVTNPIIHHFSEKDSPEVAGYRSKLIGKLQLLKNNIALLDKGAVRQCMEHISGLPDNSILMALLTYCDTIETETDSEDFYSRWDVAFGVAGATATALSAYAFYGLGADSLVFFTEMLFNLSFKGIAMLGGVCNVISIQLLNTFFTTLMVVHGGRWVLPKIAEIWQYFFGGKRNRSKQGCSINWRQAVAVGLNLLGVVVCAATGTAAVYIAMNRLTDSLLFNAAMLGSTAASNMLPNAWGLFGQVRRVFGVDKNRYDIEYIIDMYIRTLRAINQDYIKAIYYHYTSCYQSI